MKKLELDIPTGDKPTDPLEIFNNLTLRGNIENIWETQAEALKDWHQNHRAKSDLVVQMNTGGGKTLVGLLMAQSLANECDGRVLYVCANNQLIEQTQIRADEIGLTPARRYQGYWHDEAAFETGETFCLTNYHGLFNGLSVFKQEPIFAIIFDDAHVAQATIRGCFTVSIPQDHSAFDRIVQVFRSHFAHSSSATHFADAAAGKFTPVLFVPTYVTWQHADEVRQILVDSGVAQSNATKFSWAHVQAHLNHCCILMTGAGLEITPFSVPLGTMPQFADGVRRIYLTATLPSQTAFSRAFGIADPVVISPTGKSGDAQRLLVFAPGKNDDEQQEATKQLVAQRKSCVISPSKKKAEEWVPPAKIYDTDSGQEEIERFRKSDAAEMLGLVARYDGIDLPGKSCNVLILDRHPTGESLIDRFIDEGVKVETIRMSQMATRIVQAIGRIFRSNTDHGVVILVGPQLQKWMRTPTYQCFLPSRLQQQVQVANALAKKVEAGETNWPELIDAVLTGDANWDTTYKAYIDRTKVAPSKSDAVWYTPLVPEERAAYEQLWEGQPDQAADRFAQLVETAAPHDPRLAAWYQHWHGLAVLCGTDRNQSAYYEFRQAANVRAELGRPSEDTNAVLKPRDATVAGFQASKLAARYATKKTAMIDALAQIEMDLQYGDKTAKAEEAIKVLGELIGLKAERPDKKEKGAGPDVLWKGEGGTAAWGFELKTNKQNDNEYSKKDIGQCHNSEQWLYDNCGESSEIAIVGRFLQVSNQANPSEQLQVIELEGFRDMLRRAKKMFQSVDGGDKTDVPMRFQAWLDHHGLVWPACVEALASRKAIDLKAG